MDELGDKVPTDLRDKIQGLVDNLKSELSTENTDLLKSKMEELQVELTNLSNIASSANPDSSASND